MFINVIGAFVLVLSSTSAAANQLPARHLVHQHSTHRMRDLPHGVQVKAFQPESVYEVRDSPFPLHVLTMQTISTMQTFGSGITHPLSRKSSVLSEQAAMSFVASKTGYDEPSLKYKTGFVGEMAEHHYFAQRIVRCFFFVFAFEESTPV